MFAYDTLKSICYFRALDIAQTWAVPGKLELDKEYNEKQSKHLFQNEHRGEAVLRNT